MKLVCLSLVWLNKATELLNFSSSSTYNVVYKEAQIGAFPLDALKEIEN